MTNISKMCKGKLSLSQLILFLICGLKACDAFRLVEFELRPTTSTSFTCTESIASGIEMAAETCLLNQCTEYITEISFSYSNCTTQNNIAISGGVSVVNEGTIVYDPVETDTCVNSVLESDLCKELFLVVLPNLLSMKFASQYLPETSLPTKAPATSSPISPPVGGEPTMTTLQPLSPTQMPSLLPSLNTLSTQPSTAPSIQLSSKPSTAISKIPTKSPVGVVNNPVASAPSSIDKSKSNKNTVAVGAVFALTGLTILLLGYLFVSNLKKRGKDKSSTDRGPLDTTDTAFENDDDPEVGNRQVQQSFHPLATTATVTTKATSSRRVSKNALVPLESYNNSTHTVEPEDENVNMDNNDSLVLEDDELSSDSSTLFDLNGRNGYDDAASSIFYESQGEEDDEDGTEMELDGTWGPEESSVVSERLKEGDDDGESMIGSTISSLGASGVENFGENPSPQQFMEWIKKSPLIPAAAKASIVAAAVAEVTAAEDRKSTSSPVTLPLNFNSTEISDNSGRQSW